MPSVAKSLVPAFSKRLTTLLSGAAFLGLMMYGGQAQAFTAAVTLCLATGEPCVEGIPTTSPILTAASDSEAGFDPFGAGYDTSDGIVLNSGWTPDAAFAASFSPSGTGSPGKWQMLPGTDTWVLPASIPGCGTENGTTCEPIAKWDFLGGSWISATPSAALIYEFPGATGGLSDIILLREHRTVGC